MGTQFKLPRWQSRNYDDGDDGDGDHAHDNDDDHHHYDISHDDTEYIAKVGWIDYSPDSIHNGPIVRWSETPWWSWHVTVMKYQWATSVTYFPTLTLTSLISGDIRFVLAANRS